MELKLRESKLNKDIKVLDIEGRIDAFTHNNIQEELSVLLNIGSNKIVCNMPSVDYIGPAGLKTFLNAIKQARERGGDVKLAGLQPAVKRIFEFSGFAKMCVFYEDENQAVVDFGGVDASKLKKPSALKAEELYGQTMQMNASHFMEPETESELRGQTMQMTAPKFQEEDLRGQTIQMHASKPDAKKGDVDSYGSTIEMNADQFAKVLEQKEQKQEVDLYAQTIARGSSPVSSARAIDHAKLKEQKPLEKAFEARGDTSAYTKDGMEFTTEVDKAIIDKINEMEKTESHAPQERVVSCTSTYRVMNKLADGIMGKLYYAVEESACGFSKPVVLKYLKNQFVADEQNMTMLIQEVKKISMITHQHIAQIYKLVSMEGYYFIVMEYVDGVNLETMMKKIVQTGKLIPSQHTTLIVYTLCSALGYANRKKDAEGTTLEIIHGDINPQNVLISKDADVKIVSMGISKMGIAMQYQQNQMLTNLEYAAPEVVQSGIATKAGDIFSLGVLFYEMLTNKKPFSSEQIKKGQYVSPVPPSKINEKCTDIIDNVVLRCMSYDPSKRFSDFQDIALQLEERLFDKGFSWSIASFQKFLENMKIF